MNFFLIFLALGFGQSTPALAQTLTPVVYSTSTAESIIDAYAVHYGIPAKPLFDTLLCESRLNPAAAGDLATSTSNPAKILYTSFGIAQIHLPAHPEVTKAEALDPLWSINWAAQEFAAGHADLWTCYRMLEASSTL